MKTKMMIVLAMLFSLQSFGQTIGQIFASGGINYRITSAMEVEVAQNLPDDIIGAVTIPARVSFNNVIYTVTNIGGSAFLNCDKITSVTIANTVTAISGYSFAFSFLTSISIPNSVTSIGVRAFTGCYRLQTISIPNSVSSIGANAFEGSGLVSVAIPNSITRIEEFTFESCYRLESVSLGNSVTQIRRGAFRNCNRLSSCNMPNSLTAIGDNAFSGCQLVSVTIPNTVTYIDSYAFSRNIFLQTINLNWTSPLSIRRDVFDGLNLCNIFLNVPFGTETLYDGASVWNEFGGTSNLVPPVAISQTFCNTATVADLVASGQNLRWYNHNYVFYGNIPGIPNLSPLANTTNLTSGIYYVAQSAGCKESARTAVTVTVNSSAAPAASAQTSYSNATVANLVANGTDLKWYEVQTGGTALANTTPLVSATYYVSQTVNNCESPRTAVVVTILPQYTAIPDNNFELALFNKGIDTMLGDNRVLTAAIINIPTLDVSNKGIADLTGIEAFYSLTDLNCSGNLLTSLNINTVVLLQKLNCSENQIASLNLSNQTVLQLLRCEGNLLTAINTTGISNLQEVYCSNNVLTNLDFRAQTNLIKLYCNNNQITNLNVTGLTLLNQLGCNNNQLVNLNVSDASLSLLNCGNNLLTNIDFRFQEPTLTTFNCQANRFSQMDLRGFSVLSNFNCTLNPNLSCISVDDVAYANANYQKDATASFSPNCFGPITLNYCRGVIAPPLASPFSAGVTSRWYTTAVGGRATLASPTPTTTTDGTRVYYVSQVSNGVESARIAITVNTLGLPGTPGAIAGTVAQVALVGTTTAASYSVAPVANATTYNWTVPTGVNIVSGQGTTTLTVNFNNVSAGAGSIGNLMVVAVNDLGCSTRAARILALTKALPAAPTAIRMTDAGVVTTSIAKYLGQPTVLTLTANPVVGVNTYEWEMPAGVNVLSGALPVRGGALGGNVITVNFAGVTTAGMFNYTTTAGILTQVLRIGVRSITGVGASTTSNAGLVNPTTSNTARLLTLTATAPRASSAIRMTDAMATDPTRAITVISTFIGTPKTLTLTATPVATANEYNWELPAGVKQLSGGNSNEITVNFANVAAGTTSLYLGVKAMNGAGVSVTPNASLIPATNSTATLLRLSATVPATVPTLKRGNGTFVVDIDGIEAFLPGSKIDYTITPTTFANFYTVTAPTGAVVKSATKMSNTSNILTTPDLVFTVEYPCVFVATTASPQTLSVVSQNGVGSSLPRIVTLSMLTPAIGAITGTVEQGALVGTTTVASYSVAPVAHATSYNWTVPTGVNIVSGQGTTTLTVSFNDVPSGTGSIGNLMVVAVNSLGCGNSATRNLLLTKALPLSPTAIRMTDAMAVDPTRAITVISTFIGTPKTLTLTATPVATANEYSWELPAGVKQLSGGNSNVITVNFADVAAGTTSLYLGVKAMNGAGVSVTANASLIPATNSTARLLRLSAAVPGTVPAVIGQVVGLCGKNAYTYTISPSALATSYEITGPVGSNVTSKDQATNGSNVITTSDLEFTVVYPEKFATTKETPASISVIAVNGVGKSAIARTLGVTTELLRRDRLRSVPHTELSIEPKLGVGIVRSESSAFINYVTDVERVWTVNDGVEIVSGQGTDEIEIDYSKVPPTIKSTKVSMYYKNSCGVVSLPITITINLEPFTTKTAETITIEATEVYPNPVSNVFNVDVTASAAGSLTMTVYSLDGNLAMNSKTVTLQEGSNTITENVSSLGKGVYVLQLVNTSNNELITKKLIKN